MSLAEILAKLSIPRQSLIRAFAGLWDIPDKVDLVVSAVPASKTMDIVKDCADIGVRHLVKEYGKPFALWCSAMDRQEMELVEMLEARSLPVFQSSERAVQAFSAMYRYGQRTGKEEK